MRLCGATTGGCYQRCCSCWRRQWWRSAARRVRTETPRSSPRAQPDGDAACLPLASAKASLALLLLPCCFSEARSGLGARKDPQSGPSYARRGGGGGQSHGRGRPAALLSKPKGRAAAFPWPEECQLQQAGSCWPSGKSPVAPPLRTTAPGSTCPQSSGRQPNQYQ